MILDESYVIYPCQLKKAACQISNSQTVGLARPTAPPEARTIDKIWKGEGRGAELARATRAWTGTVNFRQESLAVPEQSRDEDFTHTVELTARPCSSLLVVEGGNSVMAIYVEQVSRIAPYGDEYSRYRHSLGSQEGTNENTFIEHGRYSFVLISDE